MQLPLKRKFLCSSEVPPRVKAFYSLFVNIKYAIAIFNGTNVLNVPEVSTNILTGIL